MRKVSIGVDLAASAQGRNPSAVAVLDGRGQLRERPVHFRYTQELLELLSRHDLRDVVLAVDAPRSVPDWRAENYAYRSCERVAKAIDPGAGSFSGAAALYIRWYEIETEHLRGYCVIETYPRVVWKQLGLPGKPKEFSKNRAAVCAKIGRLVGASCIGFSPHQIDAVLCAYTAFCYTRGNALGLGESSEGLIYVPAKGRLRRLSKVTESLKSRFRRFPSMSM